MSKAKRFEQGFIHKLAKLDLTPDEVFMALQFKNRLAKVAMEKSAQGAAATAGGALLLNKILSGLGSIGGAGLEVVKNVVSDYGVPAVVLGPALAGAGAGLLYSGMTSPGEREVERLKQLRLLREYQRANNQLTQMQ